MLQGGYRGFYSKNTIPLTPKIVNDIHKRGGTIIGTSRGGHDTAKIVDSIQDREINQVVEVEQFVLLSLVFPCLLFNTSLSSVKLVLLNFSWSRFTLLEAMGLKEEQLSFMR